MKRHIGAALLLRFGVILYGKWHDENLQVPFTDIDYKVFTDAARHVTEGESPYKRLTYRYPPIIAWLLIFNIWLYDEWGKLLFSIADVCTGILIYQLVKFQGYSKAVSQKCSMVWFFNPLAIIIAARGNSDSVISAIVLLSAFFLLKNQAAWAGIFLGLAIHIRLYPIIFSLPMYLSISSGVILSVPSDLSNVNRICNWMKNICMSLYPNRQQIILLISCASSLLTLTSICYALYGFEYLNESLLYHLRRKDTRHNFSVYFYLLYLKPEQPSYLIFLPQLIILIALSLVFGKKSSLLFCLFAQTFTVVSYNPVLTSQYFIWYLSLLPPNLPRLQLSLRQAAVLTALWLFSQLAWLVPAYLLEFRGKDTFLYIWFQGIGFFCANLAALVRLINNFSEKNSCADLVKQD